MKPMLCLTYRKGRADGSTLEDWLLAVRWPHTTQFYTFVTEANATATLAEIEKLHG